VSSDGGFAGDADALRVFAAFRATFGVGACCAGDTNPSRVFGAFRATFGVAAGCAGPFFAQSSPEATPDVAGLGVPFFRVAGVGVPFFSQSDCIVSIAPNCTVKGLLGSECVTAVAGIVKFCVVFPATSVASHSSRA
jgi:hypothetical protein